MNPEIKQPPKKPRDAVTWTPIPELARWERAMEQMFGPTTEKKKAPEKKTPLGNAPTAGARENA